MVEEAAEGEEVVAQAVEEAEYEVVDACLCRQGHHAPFGSTANRAGNVGLCRCLTSAGEYERPELRQTVVHEVNLALKA